ncbi:hypothetical protein AVENP_1581 [Arcobacter venerupis]|uniref:Uncharacterized protein n=1 Tax=Arcobacter venerupis TaxID=1054033 RepID=A0AAE7E3D3_9BACT|nr:hypothetical protein [Arcobacter venerupis]QKF67133.1 hypothetical protein AVENP_1581 [Arcobacter venerupis]RWS49926.1 hypothetical protein CKA56_05460 [Arcobacter venerupis]
MIIIGDNLIPFEDLKYIQNIENIQNTKANSTVMFNYNEEVLKYCYENEISSAVIVTSIKEAIYCNSLNVKYIISEKDLATQIQKIADNYMYDSKNLAIIDSNEEFEKMANNEIDGVIYRKLTKEI